jgi:hypothetical protein
LLETRRYSTDTDRIPRSAAELDVNDHTTLATNRWRPTPIRNEPEGLSTDDREELYRLRRLVKVLKRERDILKERRPGSPEPRRQPLTR